LPGGTKENHETPLTSIDGLLTEMWIWGLTESSYSNGTFDSKELRELGPAQDHFFHHTDRFNISRQQLFFLSIHPFTFHMQVAYLLVVK
jgi:hypothetical protein